MKNKIALGLKANTSENQINNRLAFPNVDIIELFLTENDLFGAGYFHLRNMLQLLKDKNITVVLHQPQRVNGKLLHIMSTDFIVRDFFYLSTKVLVDLAREFDGKAVVHFNYSDNQSEGDIRLIVPELEVKQFVERVSDFDGNFGEGVLLWENSNKGVGAYHRDGFLLKYIKDSNLSLCFDITHGFISLRDMDHLVVLLEELKDKIMYFHVADSMGIKHDALPIGCGKISWDKVLPFLVDVPLIFEIELSDIDDAAEMFSGWQYLNSLKC